MLLLPSYYYDKKVTYNEIIYNNNDAAFFIYKIEYNLFCEVPPFLIQLAPRYSDINISQILECS